LSWVASGFVGLIALLRGQEHSWIVMVVAILGVVTVPTIPFLGFVVQGVLYDLTHLGIAHKAVPRLLHTGAGHP
jgi:hypothetical protein